MTSRAAFGDTTTDAARRVIERWRAMSAREKFDLVATLNDDCDRLAAAGVRRRHPHATDEEIRLRVTALRLGRDTMIAAYDWDPDLHGW